MKKLIYTLSLLMILPGLWAQEVNEVEPPVEDEIVVGAIGGTVDISALGAAVYSIPIQVPEGIGGMQPNLSIVYNNQSGNGLLGWGWNLGGLSAITRVGQTEYHDGMVKGISLDNKDRFALDGQRLMVLDNATYGSNGAEYRTEVDGMSKIVSYTETIHSNNGGMFGYGSYDYEIISHFKVYTIDGRILYYGKVDNEPDNARIIYENNGQMEVVMWLLKRVEDRMGNYMVYNYLIDNNNHNYRLDNIQYCANSNVTDNNESNRGTKYGIEFCYDERSDVESSFIGSFLIKYPWRLKEFFIYHWTTYNDTPLAKYSFSYFDNSQLQLEDPQELYYYSLLDSISLECNGKRLKSTTIERKDYPMITTNMQKNNNVIDDLNYYYLTRVSGSSADFVKFVGDFNGDGLSDYFVTYQIGGLYKGVYYLNQGHTKNNDEAGNIQFYGDTTDVNNIGGDWVYVCDFDGDGLDDIVTLRYSNSGFSKDVIVEAYKSEVNSGGFHHQTMYFQTNEGTTNHYSTTINIDAKASLMVGDFVGRNHHDFILQCPKRLGQYPNAVYFSYKNNYTIKVTVSEVAMCGNNFVSGDFDGDGLSEVYYYSTYNPTHKGRIVKFYVKGDGSYSYFEKAINVPVTDEDKVFMGDFNGDGCTDLLCYNRNNGEWKAHLFGGASSDGVYQSYNMTDFLENYNANQDPGEYGFSIEGRTNGENDRYYVEIADMNGDGKSDMLIRNDFLFHILYGPILKRFGNGEFYHFRTITSTDIIMNGTPSYAISSGNFLGQENASLLYGSYLNSRPQQSIYYNVSNITDGMGNRTSFDYDYLVHNPMKSDNIYDVDHIGQNLGYDLYDIPLPMKAVKALSLCNIHLSTQAHAVDTFSYINVIAHRKGKGILGFGSVTRDSWLVDYPTKDIQWTKHQSKLVQTFNFIPMEEHRALVLETEELYRYRDNGEEIRTASTNYRYSKGLCERDRNRLGIKVFTPLTIGAITDEYELLSERRHLRRRMTENEYDGIQQTNGTINYHNIVRVVETRQGTDPGTPATVSNCEFRTTTHTEYDAILNSGNLWVPNRPHSVFTQSTRNTSGYFDSKLLTVYSYDNDKPYLPKFVNTYPSGVENGNDSLAMTAYYTYYPTGKLKDESHYPVVGRSEDGFKTMYEYSPDYRFLTKKTEEYDLTHTNDYETLYEYDSIYGDLKTETDCNGYSICTENSDHLGLTVRSYKCDNNANHSRIPGTETVTALRWFAGSDYECHRDGLTAPSYFSWKRSSSSAESLIIYDALGRELRTVSHGLSGNGNDTIIYQDTQYDNWGRLYKVSEPYFKGSSLEQRKWTTYNYGDFDRIAVLYGPQYTVGNQMVEPYTQYEYDGLATTVTTGVVDSIQTHVTRTTLNVMGWTESNAEVIDENGTENETTYGYNADGSLAWAKVNGDETTKVRIRYDNAGNRAGLTDPDYGYVTSQYNALGQLVRTVSPKGDVTVYEYDNLGRKKCCVETDNSNANLSDRTTVWNYSETTGSKGFLESIRLREDNAEKQIVAYNYDGQHYNRLASTTETLFGTSYTTMYSYDDLNGYPLRVKTITYPSGYTIEKGYDTVTGYLTEIHHNNQLLWKTHSANALGQITHYEMGNGVHSYYQYDDRHLLSAQQASDNGDTIQNYSYSYDIFGNLAARTEDKFNMPNTETFTYDYLNRLTTITLNGTVSSEMTYDAFGRILSKEADGQTVFSNAQYNTHDQHNNLKPHAVSSATITSNPLIFPPLEITYTMFDKVKSIGQYDENENLLSQIGYQYGYDHERILMDWGANYEKLYIGDCELITQNSSAQWNTFISGPMGVFAVVTSSGNTQLLRYIYKDHLGNWTTITDDTGTVLQELSFDAWGNLRAPGSWSGLYNGVLLYDRGFTGHEHLFDMGLINMNGRMYDPVMSSFLSVDNYIQSPDFSQSFNRYAYCLNNPLKYTDPDGETSLLIAACFLLFTETGYEIQKQLLPVAIHGDIHLSTEQIGLGVDVSFGVPKAVPFSYRKHYGATYYWKHYDNSFRGWERREGGEWTFFSYLNYSGTAFTSGETSQTTNAITIGGPIKNVKYENDYMFDLGQYFPGVPEAIGDRYRTAAVRIKVGSLSVGVNLFTGDPGFTWDERNPIPMDFPEYSIYHRMTYTQNDDGDDPDKYRAGVFYVGVGPFRLGKNSEQIRHRFQNRFAHDFIMGGESPYFKVLDIKPRWYFYFGSGTGNTLW